LIKRLPSNFFRAITFAFRVRSKLFSNGNPISDVQPNRAQPPEFAERIQIFALNPPRDVLYERINRRAEQHFANGLIEEVENLRKKGLPDDTNALGAHGYRRVCEFLRGERTLESAVEQTKQDVRNYAKRQMSWFRREAGVRWLEGFGDDRKTQENLWKMLGLE
jgi:tRNA dimethylallyltransferase